MSWRVTTPSDSTVGRPSTCTTMIIRSGGSSSRPASIRSSVEPLAEREAQLEARALAGVLGDLRPRCRASMRSGGAGRRSTRADQDAAGRLGIPVSGTGEPLGERDPHRAAGLSPARRGRRRGWRRTAARTAVGSPRARAASWSTRSPSSTCSHPCVANASGCGRNRRRWYATTRPSGRVMRATVDAGVATVAGPDRRARHQRHPVDRRGERPGRGGTEQRRRRPALRGDERGIRLGCGRAHSCSSPRSVRLPALARAGALFELLVRGEANDPAPVDAHVVDR